MSEREPTVIERMSSVYRMAYDKVAGGNRPPSCKGNYDTAMLAAVRELYEASLDTSGVWTQYGYLKNIIDEHERRAGGKGE